MRLLVSVKSAEEAAAALAGGADIVDAKDPAVGALGAVALPTFHQIVALVAARRPVTAALGDAVDEASTAGTARAYARGGAGLVKIGFAGVSSQTRITALLAAARSGAEHAGVIATAYADAERADSRDPFAIVEAAASAGVAGVLLDTADKHGPGLRALMSLDVLREWVAAARDARLLVALAGKLSADDLGLVGEAGADVVGVRGAACEHGRTGQIVAARVRQLRSALTRRSAPAPVPAPAATYE